MSGTTQLVIVATCGPAIVASVIVRYRHMARWVEAHTRNAHVIRSDDGATYVRDPS